MKGLASVLVMAALVASCASRRVGVSPVPSARQDTIAAIKRVERELGFEETGNFQAGSTERAAYYRCYYTGLLELPESYERLRIKEGDRSGCSVDENKHDVFFYAIEAVAGTDTPVTEALEQATAERLAVVILHEDFHEDPDIQSFPTRVGEAATTLVGFLTAAEFARQEYGDESDLLRKLHNEADLYLAKAKLVNSYHQRLGQLYRRVKTRQVGRSQALEEKTRLYTQMQEACEALTPDPSSFNKCLSANNNAGLAFEVTYTRFYPEVHALYESTGRDLQSTISRLRQAGAARSSKERDAVALLGSGVTH